MFGYIKPLKDELKVKEYESYKGVYCSLCRCLKKSYGPLAGLILSYDFTFVAMLGMSLGGECPGFEKKRCVYNPAKRCTFCSGGSKPLNIVAALSVMLFYHKIKDNIADCNRFLKPLYYLLLLLYTPAYKKAGKNYPDILKYSCELTAAQKQAESDKYETLPDCAAHPTAQTVSLVAAELSDNPDTKTILKNMGYHLGRWIYLIDAQDDLEDDLKNDNFNAIANKFSLTKENANQNARLQTRDYANELLNLSLAEAMEQYKKLNLTLFEPILTNILQLGMAASQQKVYEGRRNKNDR